MADPRGKVAAITPLGQRRRPSEWCKRCDRAVVVGFRVSDEAWAAVVGDAGTIRCAPCFDEEAQAKGVAFTFLEAWPVSWSQSLKAT